jgi:hypothetical protein
MKRDLDLARAIPLRVEEMPAGVEPIDDISIESHDDVTIGKHVQLLAEAGLLDASCAPTFGGRTDYYISRLTWEGHDFLPAAPNDTGWNNTNELATKQSSLPFDVIKTLSVEGTKALIKSQFPGSAM